MSHPLPANTAFPLAKGTVAITDEDGWLSFKDVDFDGPVTQITPEEVSALFTHLQSQSGTLVQKHIERHVALDEERFV